MTTRSRNTVRRTTNSKYR